MLLNYPEISVGEWFSLYIFLISLSHTVTVTGGFDSAWGILTWAISARVVKVSFIIWPDFFT